MISHFPDAVIFRIIFRMIFPYDFFVLFFRIIFQAAWLAIPAHASPRFLAEVSACFKKI